MGIADELEWNWQNMTPRHNERRMPWVFLPKVWKRTICRWIGKYEYEYTSLYKYVWNNDTPRICGPYHKHTPYVCMYTSRYMAKCKSNNNNSEWKNEVNQKKTHTQRTKERRKSERKNKKKVRAVLTKRCRRKYHKCQQKQISFLVADHITSCFFALCVLWESAFYLQCVVGPVQWYLGVLFLLCWALVCRFRDSLSIDR